MAVNLPPVRRPHRPGHRGRDRIRGREAGIPVPLNQAVTALIHGLERSWA